ncbi:MAG: minor capsid protein [Zoogloeaceae bacterium]|nr:minor capsid protein [Zoogloeaceae bacterium]
MIPRSAAAEFAYLHRLPPKEALDYLRGRGALTVTYSWQDLWQEEHAHQFTVSRLTRLDILRAIQEAITASVNGDLTRADWMRDTEALLKKEGWWGEKEIIDRKTGETVKTVFDSKRLNLIFDTNTRQAYAAGKWQRIERAKKSHPYVRYITKRDSRVRDAHKPWDNLTLPVDDPFWDTHSPPCDFRCRCRVTNMTREDYDQWAANGQIKTMPPKERMIEYENPRTGEVTRVPYGVNPGFAYNVGKTDMRARETARLVADKISASPDKLGAAFLDELSQREKDVLGEFYDRKNGKKGAR